MASLVTAIVCDPSGAEFGGDYFKIVYRSANNSADHHNTELGRVGYRVLSIKVRPVEEADLIELEDRQGNQLIVDGKVVHT